MKNILGTTNTVIPALLGTVRQDTFAPHCVLAVQVSNLLKGEDCFVAKNAPRNDILDQPQLFRPPDGCPAAVDAELAVDALGMGADGTESDHELSGDLGSGKLRPEQA